MSLGMLRRSLASGGRHVSPFLVLGDPAPEISVELAVAAVKAGATMLELGFPFSDPCADGPAIQKAILRAREAGVSTDRAMEVMGKIRARCPDIPMNLLVYGNLVHARGFERFARDAVACGASSMLVPDIPLEEGGELFEACHASGLGIVQMVAPSTPADRIRRLDAAADAFLYVTGHQGITGASNERPKSVPSPVTRVKANADSPICLGFGLNSPEGIRDAFDAGASIAVVGSHLARVIETSVAPGIDGARVVSDFTGALRLLMGSGTEKRGTGLC